jgi:hypothetical protein
MVIMRMGRCRCAAAAKPRHSLGVGTATETAMTARALPPSADTPCASFVATTSQVMPYFTTLPGPWPETLGSNVPFNILLRSGYTGP